MVLERTCLDAFRWIFMTNTRALKLWECFLFTTENAQRSHGEVLNIGAYFRWRVGLKLSATQKLFTCDKKIYNKRSEWCRYLCPDRLLRDTPWSKYLADDEITSIAICLNCWKISVPYYKQICLSRLPDLLLAMAIISSLKALFVSNQFCE